MLYTTFAFIGRLFHIISGVVFIALLTISKHGVAQPAALPCGLNYKTYHSISAEELPAIDTAWLNRQPQQAIEENVAYNFKAHFDPATGGTWKTILPGIDSWFLKLRSANAYGMGLVLSDVRLQTGEALYIYNQHALRGPFKDRGIPESHVLPVNFLQGDEILIEYDVPSGKNHGAFVVETVSHVFRTMDPYIQPSPQMPAARSGVNCYMCVNNDIIELQRRSVVKLIIQYDSISKFCTGVLMNNTAHDNKPYVLTAQHCISSQFDADRSIAVFRFEDIDCVGETHFDDFLLVGAYHRASLFENDFALLEFYEKPPLEFHPYYAGWDISDQSLDGVTCIHHPQGGPKKISLSNNAVVTGTFNDVSTRAVDAFWNVIRWDIGVTEGGSSGAPLFSNDNHVIGSLSGGSSDCGAPYNDYFEKLSVSWAASSDPAQQLKHWLDPVGSDVKKIDGKDPFENIHATCGIRSNVKSGESQNLEAYGGGDGFFSGVNSDGISSYAEKFSVPDTALLTGVTLNVGSVNAASAGGLLVTINSNDKGLPGASLATAYIPYDHLTEDSTNHIEIYPYLKVAGDFFISYTISYSPGDSFAMMQTSWRATAENTAYVKLSSGWKPITVISPNGAGAAFGIKLMICESTVENPPVSDNVAVFFPNPAAGVLIAKLPEGVSGEIRLSVFNVQGKQQTVPFNVYENDVVITTADLAAGLYIVRISTTKGVYQTKVLKH